MRKYEIMYIVRPNLEEAATKEVVERFNKVLSDNGAEVEKVEEKGKRRLAYEINDFTEGYYVLLNVNAPSEAIDEFNRLVRINDNILRHIVVKDEE
ncbi:MULTISPECIES: 30S ribosomal protein S6 [Bacillaceae]|uniref:Small ribosomal subunit protein bS6 n=1 Tax=Evansella alkalicola TaxID=745819 RepID=A0ABS6JUU5_9BACI|nr:MULTISPECIES: 30S ribosomal protein S6 [Bacillaceae]MBU9722314.1 30S ribosomal protein S6 [Bacillus alkalicola]